MDAIEASEQAACIEFSLGAAADRARVECFAVPRRKGSTRRRCSWLFLVVTDLPEIEVRDGLSVYDVETLARRGAAKTYAAWPPEM